MKQPTIRIVTDVRGQSCRWRIFDDFGFGINEQGDVLISVESPEFQASGGKLRLISEPELRQLSRSLPARRHHVQRLGRFGQLITTGKNSDETVVSLAVDEVLEAIDTVAEPPQDGRAIDSAIHALRDATKDFDGSYAGTSLVMSQLANQPFRESATFTRAEDVLMVIGPPRCGKTTGVINPNIAFARGPVVSTSTKPDILEFTGEIRRHRGQVWVYDPTGKTPIPSYARRVNWTPIHECDNWDTTRAVTTDLMETQNEPNQMSNQSFWIGRGKALLAPLLRLAHINGNNMYSVIQSLGQVDLKNAMHQLEGAGEHAAASLIGQLVQAGSETFGSISNTAAGCLDSWAGSDPGIDEPPFNVDRFIRSSDTVYVVGSGFDQGAVAPAVAAFVGTLARKTYARWRRGDPRVLFALDEVANIAPIGALPSIMSEGGGQGIQLILCFQDHSQIRTRWPGAADGFNTLARNILLFPGVRDLQTLQTLSALGGMSNAYAASHQLSPIGSSLSLNPLNQYALPPELLSELHVNVGDNFRALLFNAEGWALQQLPAAFTIEDLAETVVT